MPSDTKQADTRPAMAPDQPRTQPIAWVITPPNGKPIHVAKLYGWEVEPVLFDNPTPSWFAAQARAMLAAMEPEQRLATLAALLPKRYAIFDFDAVEWL